MSNEKFVRPRVFADGAVAVVRHPKTMAKLPAEGALVDFSSIDVRVFFMRRELEGDVAIFASAEAASANETSAPTGGASTAKPRKGAEQ